MLCEKECAVSEVEREDVLILVLMEDALRDIKNVDELNSQLLVLILVLMEDALRVTVKETQSVGNSGS